MEMYPQVMPQAGHSVVEASPRRRRAAAGLASRCDTVRALRPTPLGTVTGFVEMPTGFLLLLWSAILYHVGMAASSSACPRAGGGTARGDGR